jgi:hypothetical protein
MAEHMNVNWKGEAGARADALDQAVDRIGRERAAALGGEDEGRVRELPARLAQGSHLVATERVRRGLAVLGSTDVCPPASLILLRPAIQPPGARLTFI